MRFAITFVTMVTLAAMPVLAQDQARANTGVELVELREVVTTAEDQAVGDSATGEVTVNEMRNDDPPLDSTGDLETDDAPVDPDAGDGTEFETAPAIAGLGEEALIPRHEADDSSAEIVRAGAADTSWYRNPFVALLVVLGVIGAVAASVRRWVPAARSVTSDQLRVVGRTALSSKQSAVLLHVGKRVVLLGVTPESVNTLSEITDESEVAQLIGRAMSEDSKAKGFDAAALGMELPGSGDFDSVLAREIEQYDDVEVLSADPEFDESSAPMKTDRANAPPQEESVIAVEPAPSSGKKPNGQPPKHLNELLARLRSFQKT
jgi:flagellar biosynthetic protein FliO